MAVAAIVKSAGLGPSETLSLHHLHFVDEETEAHKDEVSLGKLADVRPPKTL